MHVDDPMIVFRKIDTLTPESPVDYCSLRIQLLANGDLTLDNGAYVENYRMKHIDLREQRVQLRRLNDTTKMKCDGTANKADQKTEVLPLNAFQDEEAKLMPNSDELSPPASD